MEETSSGLKENLAGLLCYVFGIISGLFFFLTEKKNKFVRFHSLQAIFFSAVWLIWQVASNVIFSLAYSPVAPAYQGMTNIHSPLKFLIPLVNLAGVILWVILMVKAYRGEYFLLPVLGKMAMDNSDIKK